jgi:hypothetical protein
MVTVVVGVVYTIFSTNSLGPCVFCNFYSGVFFFDFTDVLANKCEE